MDLMEFHANEKDHASTQFNLPPDMAAAVTELGKTIWPVDLHEKGREKEPHVTALYGLKGSNPVPVVKATGKLGPVTLTFGKVSVFKVPAKGFDVVKIDVRKTPGLMAVREALEKLPRVAPSFPDYEPHVTVAYVKPGQGEKYCGRCELTGKSVTVGELRYSDRQEQKTVIPLTGDVRQKVNAAVPALGYTLAPLRCRGVKVNEFDPNQPRDESGKWTAAGEYAAKLDTYAAEYQTEGRVAEAAAATQAALLLRGHDYRASETVLREAELHRDIPNTHIAILRAADEAYIAKNYGANWGMEAGTFTAWRAGAVTGTPRGVFFSIDKAGADAYGVDGRATHRYSVAIKNPLVIDRLEPAYAQLTGKSLDAVYAEKNRRDPMKWWRDTDAKIGRLAQANGYDAIVYTRPAPPAIRELVVFDKKAITLDDEPKANEQDEEGNEGKWVTMSGTPVFIKDGEDAGAAAARTFKNKPSTEEPQKKEGVLKKWLREKTAPLREAFEQGRAGAKPATPMRKAIPVTSKPAAVSGKIQRIREVGLGAKETVAELFYKRHVDEVFSGKVTAADKVDALMKKGVIKTGSEKPDVVRERAIRDFDKAVVLREQAAADRTESGEGKRAYTDKTLRAGLQKGETLAERYFPGHVDDLYNGTMSVTAKVDSMIEGGELGFGRGDKGFTKMRETAIKDFTRALNLREASDVKEEKRKLEDAKPKKLTKREQQAEWTPSEEEVLASGPVVSSGTGWKRNMAENQPRDENGKWTDGGDVAEVTDYLENPKAVMSRVDGVIVAMEEAGEGDADNRRYDALNHISMVLQTRVDVPLSQRQWHRFAFSMKGKDAVAAGHLVYDKAKKTAELTDLGSIEKGEGRKVLDMLVRRAQNDGVHLLWLTSTGGKFYTDYGFKPTGGSRVELDLQKFKANAFDPNQPRDTDGKWTSIGPVYHGTRREFTEFDNAAQPVHRIGDAAVQPPFIYFSGEERSAVSYAYRGKGGHPRIIAAMLNMKNPLDITDSIRKQRKRGVPFGKAKQEALSQLTDAHDGFIYRGDTYNAAEYAVRSPQQITTVPKANAFDPNQPRDAAGKWWNGSKVIVPDFDSDLEGLRDTAQDIFDSIPEYAKENVRSVQVLPASQSFPVSVDGQVFGYAAGSWGTLTGVISLYGIPGADTRVITHEVGHALHDSWSRSSSYEASVLNGTRPDLMNSKSGYAKESKEKEVARLAPLHDTHERYYTAWQAGGDGVTAYSRAWGLKGQWCETTAELFSIYHVAGGGKAGREAVLSNAKQQAAIMFPPDSRWGGLSRSEREGQSVKLAKAFLDMIAVKEGHPPAKYKTPKTNAVTGTAKTLTLFFRSNGEECEVSAGWAFGQQLRFDGAGNLLSSVRFVPKGPKTNAFDPNQPRDEDGKWTGGTLNFSNEPERVGGFTKDSAIRRSTVTGTDGKPVTTWHNPDGSQVTDPKITARAELLAGTKATAPNYKGAWLNPNLESPLLAIAFDQKDRKHYVYDKAFEQGNAEEKFKTVAQMEKDLPAMRGQAAKDRSDGVPEAYLFKLEDLTCIRVGSDKDTGAETKAYGLTTLRGEHVKVEGDLIKLEFPAKGGDVGSYVVKDRELAAFITERKTANGDGELWPDVTAAKFNAYLKKLDPTPDSPVTAHKFRHYHATRLAEGVVAQYEGKTLGAKEFKAVQREACEAAAAHLANTWSVCREKYVNPTVWGRLTVKAALKGNMAENQPRDEDGKWTDDGGGWSWRNNKSSPAEAFAASLSQEERDRIQNYYTAGTDEVNYPLREGRQLKGELEVTSKLLDKCFYDAPPLPKPITLYRVIPMAAATNWMEGVDERGNIRDAAYVSTTASEGAISRIQEDLDEETFVFEIKVPAGAKVLPLAELSGGHFGWQEEYLLPRNSKFHDNGDGTLSLVTVRRDGRLSTSV